MFLFLNGSDVLKKRKFLATLAFMFLFAPSVYANPAEESAEPIVQLERVEVTGSRLAETLADVPSAAYAITSQDIILSGARTLQEVFARIPGIITLANSASMTQAQGLFMRGLNTEILLLVDGVSYMNASYGTGPLGSPFDLRNIPLDSVERIEVIKGASSALYGSHAAAGVINIITRKGANKTGFATSLEAGNASWFKGTAQAQAVGETVSATLRYTRTEEGKTKIREIPLDRAGYDYSDTFKGNDWALRLDGDRWSAIAEGGDHDSKWNYTNTWTETPTIQSNTQKNDYSRLQAQYSDGTNSGKIYYNANNRDVVDASGFSSYRDNAWGAMLTRRQKLFSLPAAFGLDWRSENSRYSNRENPYGDDTPYDLTRNGISPFLEVSIPVGDLAFDIGARYEYWDVDNGEDVNEFVPRFSLGWETPTGKFWYLTAGRFFAMPSFYQIFLPARGLGHANPNLSPEKGWTVDFGTRDTKAKNPWSLGAFYMNIDDKINYKYDPVTWVGQYVNAQEYRAWGIEGTYTLNLSKQFSYTEAFSWIDAEQKDHQGDSWKRSDLPRWTIQRRLNYRQAPWEAEVSLQTLRDRSLSNPVFDDDSIYIANAALTWEKGEHRLRLACSNLFDKQYVIDNEGYLTAERRYSLSWNYRF